MTKRYILTCLLLFLSFGLIQSQVTISGTVKRALSISSLNSFPEVVMSGDVNLSMNTLKEKYEFTNIPIGSNIELKANLTNFYNPLTGVNTLDLVYINNHILGKKKISNPYKLLAADYNQDKNISVGDIVLLRNLILHIISTYPFGDSWKVKAVTIVDPNDQTKDIIKNSVTFNNIQQDQKVHFLAYKLGDVSGDGAFEDQHEVRSNEIYSLKTVNQKYSKGDRVEMLVKGSDLNLIQGMQFTMIFDKHSLGFIGIKGEQDGITDDNFSVSDRCAGYITASILTDASYINDNLFTLSFKAREDGELKYNVSMCSNLTPSEAYNSDLETMDLKLEFEEPAPKNIVNQPILYQNEPNPFFTNTTVSFEIPEAQEASLSFYNADGKLVKLVTENYSTGLNTVKLELADFPVSGVYYYQLKTRDFVGVKKMMVVK